MPRVCAESGCWISHATGWCAWCASNSIGVSMPSGGVAALAVVEDLEVLEDRVGQLEAGPPPLAVQQLDLHAAPERLDHGVVVAVADRSHRRHQPGGLGAVG